MIAAILVVGVLFLIVVAAVRIIMGWVLPATTVRAIDKAVDWTAGFILKLFVVAIAAFIVFALYEGANGH
ncbi:hypothetical protein [Rhodoblastus sp.]|uniref:hypothetical protein n=1 Tax=Rhodoblastus sp. TaxID=1962975 RepID=UPI003F9E9CC3